MDKHAQFYRLLEDFSALLAGRGKPAEQPAWPNFKAPEKPKTVEPSDKSTRLGQIANQIKNCRACSLREGRVQSVAGEGVKNPQVMVIGEAPGAREDRSGRPFVGPAGAYLDKWLAAIGLSRQTNCFIGNLVKCRPPNNRDPLPDEMSACQSFLNRQIEILRPKAILCVGRLASQKLSGNPAGIGRLRGQTFLYQGISVFVTYHPSAVLRDPSYRSAVWQDLRKLDEFLKSETWP